MEYKFNLPLGLVNEDGETFKIGTMRPATAMDEIEVQGGEKNHIDQKYRDLEMISKTIVSIDGVGKVTPSQLEELFEVDFIYLQMFFNELNGNGESMPVTCPKCGESKKVKITDLYSQNKDKKEQVNASL